MLMYVTNITNVVGQCTSGISESHDGDDVACQHRLIWDAIKKKIIHNPVIVVIFNKMYINSELKTILHKSQKNFLFVYRV